MSSKRQQTMAKMTRERTVRERRAKKLEKKQAAKAEKKARAAGEWPVEESEGLPTDVELSGTELESPLVAPEETLSESAKT
jgi:hypothetical protein